MITVRDSHGYNSSDYYIPAKFGKSGRLNTILFKDGKEYNLTNGNPEYSISKISNEANVNDEDEDE